MRRYETTFVLRPSLSEEEINSVIERTTTILTGSDGKIIELDRWGMKKLAYQIKKESQGFYVFSDYCSTPEAVAEMERRFRLDDAVLRYMTIKLNNDISEEEIAEATAQAEQKKAAAAVEAETTDDDTDSSTGLDDDDDTDDDLTADDSDRSE